MELPKKTAKSVSADEVRTRNLLRTILMGIGVSIFSAHQIGWTWWAQGVPGQNLIVFGAFDGSQTDDPFRRPKDPTPPCWIK